MEQFSCRSMPIAPTPHRVDDDVIDDAVMEEVSKSRTETSVTALRKPDKKKSLAKK